MILRFFCLPVLIALAVSACAARNPAVLNVFNGPERPDSEVAVISATSAQITTIDGKPVPKHPDPRSFYYHDFRLPPGQHDFTVRGTWGASVLVSPSGYIEGSRAFTLRMEPGHAYQAHADRTHGYGYRLYFWVEDATAGKIVAGEKLSCFLC